MNHDLLNRLVSKDWRERHAAIEQMSETGNEELAKAVLEIVRLSHADLSTLSGTLQALEQIGRMLTGELIAMLKSPDRDLHTYIPLVLGALGDPAAIPALAETARDASEGENARFNAIEALGRLDPARAAEPVRQQVVAALRQVLAEATPFLCYAAVITLGQCAEPALIPDLLPLLEDAYLSEPVIVALGQLAGSESSEAGRYQAQVAGALTRFLASADACPAGCESVVTALGEIAQHAVDLDAVRRAFLTAVGPQGSPSRLRLLALSQLPDIDSCEREDMTASLARLLGWMVSEERTASQMVARGPGDPAVRSALAHLVGCSTARPLVEAAFSEAPLPIPTELLEMLHSEEAEQSKSAARFLVNLARSASSPEERLALADIFAGELHAADEMLVTLCAEGLGSLGPGAANEQHIEALIRLLALSSARIRKTVIETLAKLQPAGLEQRIEVWMEDPNPNLRESALRLLAALPEQAEVSLAQASRNQAAISTFAALVDPSPDVRRAAVELLPRFDDPQVVSALNQALQDPDERMRISAVRACAELPPEAGQPLLENAVQDEDHWVRMHAVRALCAIARPESLPIVAFYLHDPFPPVRIAAIEGLTRFNDPNALDRYLHPLLEDQDAEVRRAAQEVLKGGK